jgi:hypothetical protein
MGQAVTQFTFGRVESPPDKRDHLMSAVMAGMAVQPRVDKHWPAKSVLNQGLYPECGGFSWAHWGICAPVEQKWTNAMGRSIYRECKKLDGSPNEDGTTLRAGAKVMLTRGRIQRYFWAGDVDEALEYVSRYGPVVFGSVWTASMCRPSFFSATIKATGKVVGGHAYLVCGVQWSRNRARIHQSWGIDWGDDGECWISIPDLRAVYKDGGEACAALERPIGGLNA